MCDAEHALAGRVHRAACGRHLLVLLDFDGTLSEFQPDPAAVQLPERRRAVLRQLRQRATVGVISGRRLEDVRGRVGLDGIVVAGLHGLEIEGLGEWFVHPDLAAASASIVQATADLREKIRDLPGVFVEDKGASVALHFREADADAQREAVDLFAAAAAAPVECGRLRVMRGSYVLELLPNIDWNKGHAVLWIAERARRLHGDTYIVYVGDDVTDQDAFAVVEAEGLPIAASERVITAHQLAGPAAVERFLAAL